MGLEKTT